MLSSPRKFFLFKLFNRLNVAVITVLLISVLFIMTTDTDRQHSRNHGYMEQGNPSKPFTVEDIRKLPMYFEANQGQTDDQAKFISRGKDYNLFLTSNTAVLSLQQSTPLLMQLVNANPNPEIMGIHELPGKSHYYIGNDPARWRTGITNYQKVKYTDIYPGIDLVYYGNQSRLEYDFIISPGVNPEAIEMEFNGVDSIKLDQQGNLALFADAGEVTLCAPHIYQEINETESPVAGCYSIDENQHVRFQVENYNAAVPLIIDPVLLYSTYIGGAGNDEGFGIVVDNSGNIYLTGETSSADFPTTNDLTSGNGNAIFVTKINADGDSWVYSTLIGSPGSSDRVASIKIDEAGNTYIAGRTSAFDDDDSPDVNEGFPTVNGIPHNKEYGDYDAIICKLDPAGNLDYSTYLGGPEDEQANCIAIDSDGCAYVVGYSLSAMGEPSFPIVNPFPANTGYNYNGFVTKLDPSESGEASIVYSFKIGGGGYDECKSITVDHEGYAYITGHTSSSNFTLVNALQTELKGDRDAFVLKLKPVGNEAVYCTYLGGDANDSGLDIETDNSGNAYILCSASEGFPTTPNAYQTVSQYGYGGSVLLKINSGGDDFEYSTYTWPFRAEKFELNKNNASYLIGYIFIQNNDGTWRNERRFAKLNPDASDTVFVKTLFDIEYSEVYIRDFYLSSDSLLYLTGVVSSDNFPVVNPLQDILKGTQDAFISKLSEKDDILEITSIEPDPEKDCWLDNVLRPGNKHIFTLDLKYTLFSDAHADIRINIQNENKDILDSVTRSNVPGGSNLRIQNVQSSEITIPGTEECDSVIVKVYLIPKNQAVPTDSAEITYRVVVHNWTFMVYLNGDCDLEYNSIVDYEEMSNIGSNDSLAIILLWDRHPRYYRSNPDWDDTKRVCIQEPGVVKHKSLGELNMGDPNTLLNFIRWGMKDFPAEHYALVLWDHGDGWMAQHEGTLQKHNAHLLFPHYPPGVENDNEISKEAIIDESDNDRLMSSEILAVLRHAPHLDILAFDACLMAMVENVYQYRQGADYFIASEDVIPVQGWPYDTILKTLKEFPDMTPYELSQLIVEHYGYSYPSYHRDITLSATTMSKAENIKDAIDYFAEMLIKHKPWDKVTEYLESTKQFRFLPYRDISHFASFFKSYTDNEELRLASDWVMTAIDEAIIANYHCTTEPNSYGLTIYFPKTLSESNADYLESGNIKLCDDTLWDEFLLHYLFREYPSDDPSKPFMDTYEPNNTVSQAFGPLLSRTKYQSYIPLPADEDYFFFSTGQQTALSIKLTCPQGINYDFEVMDVSETTIAEAQSEENVDSLYIAAIQPGIYYIKIITNGNFIVAPYTLELEFDGAKMGQVPISFDDGTPDTGIFSTHANDVIMTRVKAPYYPMKLDNVGFYIQSKDGAGTGGDGSFYVWMADHFGTMTEPFKVTPNSGNLTKISNSSFWFYQDVTDLDITLETDFFVGIGYDSVNTPALGIDTTDNGKTFHWTDSSQTWTPLKATAFIRTNVSYLESPEQVVLSVAENIQGTAGDSILIPVNISNILSPGIDSLELTILFEPDLLAFKSISLQNTLTNDWTIGQTRESVLGQVSVSLYAGTPVSAPGTLLNIHFDVFSTTTIGDTSDIIIDYALLNNGKLHAKLNSGKLKVTELIPIDDHTQQHIPETYALFQNYPNPFNPETIINYQLPRPGKVELSIHNITGQRVTILVSDDQPAGYYQYQWNAGDLPSGVYFSRLAVGNFIQIRKLILLK